MGKLNKKLTLYFFLLMFFIVYGLAAMFPHCVKIKARSSWKLKKAGKLIAAGHTGTLFSVPRNIMERGLMRVRIEFDAIDCISFFCI